MNFVFSVVAVTSTAPRCPCCFRRVVPGVYVFFSLTFLALWAVTVNVAEPVLFNKIFYVWVSIFSLFHLSVFMKLMADLYDRGQAKRLFGFIAAGTSTSAISIGPALTILLGERDRQRRHAAVSILLVPDTDHPVPGSTARDVAGTRGNSRSAARRAARRDPAPASACS